MPGFERCLIHGTTYDPNQGCPMCAIEKTLQSHETTLKDLAQMITELKEALGVGGEAAVPQPVPAKPKGA